MLARPTLEEQIAAARARGMSKVDEYWLRMIEDNRGRKDRLQREHQADHHQAIDEHEFRVGEKP